MSSLVYVTLFNLLSDVSLQDITLFSCAPHNDVGADPRAIESSINHTGMHTILAAFTM